MFGALLLGISSCRFMPVAEPRAVHTLSVTASRASVLVIIVDEDSRAALRDHGSARSCLGTPARTGHHPDLSGRSDPGLLAGSGLPYPSGACSSGTAPIPANQLPGSQLPAGSP